MTNIVLVNPQIPQNTGTIGRLCVNIDATLHLIKPLGFEISEKRVKRAGLDYWSRLKLVTWDDLDSFLKSHPIGPNTHLLTTKTTKNYFEANFARDDYLIFGPETTGLEERLLKQHSDRCLTIPMSPNGRSLNLSICVGIVAYELTRQNIIRGKQ